mmetsp:Transcript_1188/g.1934  ORF Transcript_1188/g.1934 Transcript_1188/m.1934 type:complete len:86 (+) Transcript_1188:1341-1598(+)
MLVISFIKHLLRAVRARLGMISMPHAQTPNTLAVAKMVPCPQKGLMITGVSTTSRKNNTPSMQESIPVAFCQVIIPLSSTSGVGN